MCGLCGLSNGIYHPSWLPPTAFASPSQGEAAEILTFGVRPASNVSCSLDNIPSQLENRIILQILSKAMSCAGPMTSSSIILLTRWANSDGRQHPSFMEPIKHCLEISNPALKSRIVVARHDPDNNIPQGRAVLPEVLERRRSHEMGQLFRVPDVQVENEMFDDVPRRGVQGAHRIVERIVQSLAFDLHGFIPVQPDRDFQRPKTLHLLKIGVLLVAMQQAPMLIWLMGFGAGARREIPTPPHPATLYAILDREMTVVFPSASGSITA
ncbi:hypothetical protein C8J57DRAFT_1213964 [Mycena rebaudengoi]|nr:hypothetical protein C8J57DRAFT_1213964 [Mycena rebaudengoi]